MYAMLVVNPYTPGNNPGITEYLTLNGLGWNGSTAIPFAFWKQFKDAEHEDELSSKVAADLELAASTSDWESHRYKLVSCRTEPM